jgi:2'-5' RNA ligase
MHRLFVALRPPIAMRQHLLATMGGVPGARWQDDAQLHLTLRFIGEVDAHRGDDIVAALGGVRGAVPAIGVEGVGHFGSPRPHSLWAGVRGDAALLRLRQSVERALVRVGLAPESRAFRPHITLARLSRSAGPIEPWLAATGGLHLAAVPIDHLLLFESHLGSAGARYEAVERYPLG